jgi:LysM repeat protein
LVAVAAIASLGPGLYPALANAAAPYSVRAGDTLFSIGSSLGVPDERLGSWVEQVVTLNGLESADVLRIGQSLTLPASAGPGAPTRAFAPTASGSSYTVKSGDTLLGIAERFNVPAGALTEWMDQVIAMNGLRGADALQMGEDLRLPATGRANAPAVAVASEPQAFDTYLVKAGDTLFAIAESQGVAGPLRASWMDRVVSLNGLDGIDALRMGEQLRLPGGAGTPAPAAGTVSQVQGVTVHVVKPGETLYAIAAREGVPEADFGSWFTRVLELNNLSSPDLLSAGAGLKLPARNAVTRSVPSAESLVPYTVATGDSLTEIASKSGVPAAELSDWIDRVLELNGLSSPNQLRVGASLRVPKGRSSPQSSVAVTAPTRTYAVQTGDTLSDIAAKSGIPEAELAAWLSRVVELNSLPGPEALRAGMTLQVPLPTGTSVAATLPVAVEPQGWSATGSSTYVVQAGETLSSIATKSGVPTAQVPAWIERVEQLSRIDKNDALVEGEVLLIPASQVVPAAASASGGASAGAAVKPAAAGVKYRVKAGDSLHDIAELHGISGRRLSGWIDEVLELNSVASANMIIAGTELLLPADSQQRPAAPPAAAAPSSTPASAAGSTSTPAGAPALIRGSSGSCFYTVQAADTWEGIAQKLGVAPDRRAGWIASIRDLNGLGNSPPPVGDGLRMLC